ncbi:unnamed protein product [Ceutorhynchus assimilis]|uniref:RETREG1-3/ARL6IP-like N-terminal reticulon-homology domain-containing protein n=1 Tax=Ceutorhynchus assimilis TaxID=467358 RepID=A0A9N9MDH8_9CUCU|nr:unnamed protein product [Ceutorhynchus assimilis]
MMNLAERMRNYVASFFLTPENGKKIHKVTFMDLYLEKALQILYWQSTEMTLRVFFSLNTLFWIILMLNIRFYGAISLLTLIFFVFDSCYRNTLFTEYTGEYSGVIRDINCAINKGVEILYSLRRESPIVFYPAICSFFMTLHMLSNNVPGEFLFYMMLLTVFFLPLGFQLLPEPITLQIKQVFNAISTPKCNLAEYELIPFIQDKDLTRRDADLESLLTDRTADSVTNSLASGLSTMPSYLEISGGSLEIEEEDLIPHTTKSAVSFTPGEVSSDSDSDNREIKFDSDHFNTSSSEEDRYAIGLTSPKASQATPKDDQLSLGMIQSMVNIVSNRIVSNMFQSSLLRKSPPKKTTLSVSDSDSDFEMVDPDEIADEFEKDD